MTIGVEGQGINHDYEVLLDDNWSVGKAINDALRESGRPERMRVIIRHSGDLLGVGILTNEEAMAFARGKLTVGSYESFDQEVPSEIGSEVFGELVRRKVFVRDGKSPNYKVRIPKDYPKPREKFTLKVFGENPQKGTVSVQLYDQNNFPQLST